MPPIAEPMAGVSPRDFVPNAGVPPAEDFERARERQMETLAWLLGGGDGMAPAAMSSLARDIPDKTAQERSEYPYDRMLQYLKMRNEW